jgi:hypothetical protein
LVQLGQGGVGLLGHEHEQVAAACVGHLDGGAAAPWPCGERAGLPTALEQTADPGGADAEQFGKGLAGVQARVAGAHDPLAKVV